MPRRRLASRISQLTGEGALAVFTRAKQLELQGRSIIHLELGEPDFHPAAPVVDSLRNAVASGRDRYCNTRGIPALREEIALYLARTRKLSIAPEQVLVAPGCKMALALAMMALIEPGDQVLYPDPGFPIYPSFPYTRLSLAASAPTPSLLRSPGKMTSSPILLKSNRRSLQKPASSSSIPPTTLQGAFSPPAPLRASPPSPSATTSGCSLTKSTPASCSTVNISPFAHCPEWPNTLSSSMA